MTRILFVCVENAGRSQMAEAFANYYGKGKIMAFSAGSKPRNKIYEFTIEVMKDKNIDISKAKPKGFSDLSEKEFDYLVTMGCKDSCPIIPAKQNINWDIPDPKNLSIESFKEVRDIIEHKVQMLFIDLEKENLNGKTF